MDKYTLPEGISVGTNAAISKLAFDKTVKVQIEKIKDLKEGSYWGRYQNSLLTIYSKDLKKVYKEGAEVYITIPEGDFSNKKFIDTSVSFENGKEPPETDLNQLKNVLIPVSPDFVLQKNEIGLVAGPAFEEGESQDTEKERGCRSVLDTSSFDENNFKWYANNYDIIEVQADFRTIFYKPDSFTKSNYGLDIKFSKKQLDNNTEDNNSLSLVIDAGDFNGNPNYFTNYSTQKFQFEIKRNTIEAIEKIDFFETYDISDHKEEIGEIETNNIFVKNIIIRFLEKRDLSKSPYYLNIEAPEGHIVSNNDNPSNTNFDIKLKGTFYENGSIIKPEKYFWFRKSKTPILPGMNDYNKDAGCNWEKISPKDNKIIINTNTGEFSSTEESIPYEQWYKLIVQYKNQLFSAETAIRNSSSLYDIIIEQKGTKLKLYKVEENEKQEKIKIPLYGKWFIKVNDNTGNKYIQMGDLAEYFSNIDFKDYLSYALPEVQCLVYTKQEDSSYLTTKNQKLSFELNDAGTNQYSIQFIGDSVYKYDANGDISLIESEKPRELYIRLYNSKKDENVDSSKFQVYINKTLLEENKETIVEDSLLRNVKLYQGTQISKGVNQFDIEKKISYNISNRFEENKRDCHILVVYEDEDENIYKFEKDIVFLKDGDQGTNGTSYSAIITPCTSTGENLENAYLLYNLNSTSPGFINQNLFFKAKVYKDGVEIFNNIEYQWSCGSNLKLYYNNLEYKLSEDEQIKNADLTSPLIEVRGLNNNSEMNFYIKAHIKVEGIYLDIIHPIDVLFTRNQTNINMPSVKINLNGSDFQSGATYISVVLTNQDGEAILDKNGKVIRLATTKDRIKFEGARSMEYLAKELNGGNINFNSGYKVQYLGGTWVGITLSEPNKEKAEYLSNNNYYYKLVGLGGHQNINAPINQSQPKDRKFYKWNPFEIKFNAPNYIQYNSSGEHPLFNRAPLEFFVDGIKINNENITSEKEDILSINKDKMTLNPCSKLIEQDYIGILKFLFNDGINYFIHPIIMYLNTYGNEALNGWDGTKLSIDGAGQYIYAPQIGAGEKDSATNKFTGVVMGRDSGQDNKIGLYGYDRGIASFGFRDDGSAFIGRSDQGRILFNSGSNGDATITSSTWKNSQDGTGVYLNLTSGILKMRGTKTLNNGTTGFIDLNANANVSGYPLKIGIGTDPNFKVGWNGNLDLKGYKTVYSYTKVGKINQQQYNQQSHYTYNQNSDKYESSTSYNANTEYYTRTSSEQSQYIKLNASAETSPLKIGTKFKVDWDGTIHAENVDLKGYIEANSGTIGGWQITSTQIKKKDNEYIYLDSSATGTAVMLQIGSGETNSFQVNANGNLTAYGAIIHGNITATGGTFENITMGGNITWTSTSNPVKVKYKDSNGNYSSAWLSSWDDDNTIVVYAKYSYDNGKTWSNNWILVKGKNGEKGDGANLDDYGITQTTIGRCSIESPFIKGGRFQTSSASNTEYCEMHGNFLDFYSSGQKKGTIGLYEGTDHFGITAWNGDANIHLSSEELYMNSCTAVFLPKTIYINNASGTPEEFTGAAKFG